MWIPPIPLDVGLVIMEWTARCSKKDACTMSLLSKDIQTLTDKILFEYVTVYGVKDNRFPSHWSIPEHIHQSLLEVFSSSPSPRIERVRTYITSFSCSVPTVTKYRTLFLSVMKTCPNLRSFATTGLIPVECEKLSSTRLKQLCFTAGLTYDTYRGDFSNSIFHHITHLDLGFFVHPILEQMEEHNFHDLPNLTHISFRIPRILFVTDVTHFSRLLPKSVKVALVFVVFEPERVIVARLEEDPRIVLCLTLPSISRGVRWSMHVSWDDHYDQIALQGDNEWGGVAGETIWEKGTRIAEEHMKEVQRADR